jgi:hypothetical protein
MKYISILLLFITTTVSAQWHRLLSPPAPGPNVVVTSPDLKQILAGTSDGLWQASQIDGPWTLVGFRGLNISAVGDFVFSGQGNVLFVSNGTGLYRSIDSGKSWSSVLSQNVFAITQDGINITVAISGYDTVNTFLRSSDVGQTWKTFAAAPPAAKHGFSFLQFYSAPQYSFAVSVDFKLWRLPRSGGTWQSTGYTDPEINSITSFNNTIFVGALGHVYLSTDFGASWIEPLGYGLDTTRDFINALAVNGLTMVGSTNDGLIVSTDGGRNWVHTIHATDINALSFTAGNFLMSTGSGLYASTDGLAWHFVSIPSQAFAIRDIVTSKGFVFARTGSAIYQSSDRGRSWLLDNGPTGIWNLRKSGDDVLALGQQTIWRWRPSFLDSAGPGSWDSIQTSQRIGYGGAVRIGDTIFFANGGSNIFRSDDRGQSWDRMGFPGGIYTSSMFTTDDTLFVLSNEDHWNLYVSIDRGVTWTKRKMFPEIGGTFRSFVATNGPEMALWFDGSLSEQNQTIGPRMYQSSDFGRTWTLDTVNVDALSTINHSILASAFSKGINTIHNLSNGRTITVGDSITQSIFAIAGDDSLLYLGTDGQGLWASALADLPLSVRSEHSVAQMQMELYPNPAHRTSNLSFTLAYRDDIRLDIFNALGETVFMQDLGMMEAGEKSLPIATNVLSSGVYSVRISSDTFATTAKLIVSH